MNILDILFWIFLALFTALPIIFPDRKIIRWSSVIFILIFALDLMNAGLHMAARNVTMPSIELAKSVVPYGEAWQAGRLATQERVDVCLLPLLGIFISMALISLFSTRKQKS